MNLKRSGRLGVFIIFCFFIVQKADTVDADDVVDFQISSEPVPSLILQKDPRLFPAPDGSFLMIWEDYRLGERSYFAQRFDSSGILIGKNFPVVGNKDMAFLPNGYGMIIGTFQEQGLPLLEDSWFSVKGQFVPLCGSPSDLFYIDGNIFPECGTGFWGLDAKLVAAKSTFLFGYNFGGALTIKRLNPDGSVAFDSDDKLLLPQAVASFSLAVNDRDEYVLLWFNADPYSVGLPSGIYATFFNQEDSIISNHCLVKQYNQRYRTQNETPKFRAIVVSDTLFQFLWVDADSLTLNYVIYNTSGQEITPVTSLDLPFSLVGYGQEINNFAFTNTRYGIFGLLMTFTQFIDVPTMPDIESYETQIYWFDKCGILLNKSPLDYFSFLYNGENLAQLSPNMIACPLEISNDVFLGKRNDSAWLDSLQVNDDKGSNQTVPRAVIKDSQSFYVSWQSEKGFFGRAIDLDGNYLSDEQLLKGKEILFLSNGTAINFWSKYNDYRETMETGITFYDTHTWNVQNTKMLYLGRPQIHCISAMSISDSSFIVLINKGTGLSLIIYASNGQILAERNIALCFASDVGVFQNDSASFWVLGGGMAQLFSKQLQPISSIFELGLSPQPILHFGQGRFLKIFLSGDPPGYFASVIDTTGTRLFLFQLTNDIHANNFSIALLDSTKFLAMWTINKQIYARSFCWNGKPLTEPLIIFACDDAYGDWGKACVNNNKVFFVWADTRNYGQGYNIYGNIYDLNKITPVVQFEYQENFLIGINIEQIYPNPFNTSTTITFSITNNKMIHLEIFNIIGKKVKTILADDKPVGHFQVQWDGTDELNQPVASGIYFCKLQANRQSSEPEVQVGKLILLR